MIQIRTAIRLLCLTALLSLQACTTPLIHSPQEEGDSQSIKLKMAAFPFLSIAPIFIAEEKGYFAEQGIEVAFVQLDSGAQALPLLIQGDLDVGAPALSAALFNAIHRGGQIQVVASNAQWPAECPYSGLLSYQAEVTRDNLSALGGQDSKLAVNQADTGGYFVDEFLHTADFSLDNFAVNDLPPPAIGEALQGGDLALAQASEPWLTRLLDQGASLVVGANEIKPDGQLSVVVFGPSILQNQPLAGEKFLTAFLKGVRTYNGGKTEENLAIISKYTNLEIELLRRLC